MGVVRNENGKVYIENVRKVSWDTGEMCEFASSFVSALHSLGEDVPYDFIVGVSGAAFRFALNPGAWDFGNYSIRNLSPDKFEPARRAFEAVGYTCSLREPGDYPDDAARIMTSIERGAPALAFGVVGPSDCCVITGYDEGGAVLLGWSTYQDIPDDHDVPHDATGYFRKPGWRDNLHGYMLIGEKVAPPALRATYLSALRWAIHLMRTPQIGRYTMGLEGLRGWADEMTQAQYFPAGEDELIGWRYVSAAVNMTMLRDHCLAEPFLRRASADVPEFAPELTLAADCYGRVRQIRDGMDALIADNFSEASMRAIHDPSVRQAYAEAILRIRDVEAEAATHIEQLLARCG